jgi:regulatory protein
MNEIIQKMQNFCAYRDRSEKEARLKLCSFKQSESINEEIIQLLRNDKFIDDERFAENYIRSKFRSAQWGKIKIKMQLQLKGVNNQIIKQHLDSIDEESYLDTIKDLIAKWLRSHITDKDYKAKLYRFLLSKGFENDIIMECLKKI